MYTFELLMQGAKFESARLQELGMPPRPRCWHFGVEPDPEVYNLLLPYIMVAQRYEGFNEEETAIFTSKLATTFPTAKDALDYLEHFFKKRTVNPISEACAFQTPDRRVDLEVWQNLAKKFLTKPIFRTVLRQAEALERKLQAIRESLAESIPAPKGGCPPLSFDEFLDKKIKATQKMLDKCLGENNRLAKELLTEPQLRSGHEETIRKNLIEIPKLRQKLSKLEPLKTLRDLKLENLLELIEDVEYPSKLRFNYTGSLNLFLEHKVADRETEGYLALNKTFAGKFIPEVVVRGKDLEHLDKSYARYYMMKLDPTDLRAAILGDLTGCCQSIHAAGKGFVEFGLTSPNYGFYVLFKGDSNKPNSKDEVYAQSIVWLNRDAQALVFDSIEAPLSIANLPDKVKMVAVFYQHLADKLIVQAEQKISSVLVGVGVSGKTFNRVGYEPVTEVVIHPPEGSPIYDSAQKRILAKKTHDSIEEELFYHLNRGNKEQMHVLLQRITGDRKNLLTRLVRAAIFQDRTDLAGFLCEQGEVDEEEILKPFVKGWIVVSPVGLVAMTGTEPMLTFLFSRFPTAKKLLDVVYLDKGQPALLPLESAINRGDAKLIDVLLEHTTSLTSHRVYHKEKEREGSYQLRPLASRVSSGSCENALSSVIVNKRQDLLEKIFAAGPYPQEALLSAFAEAILLLDYGSITFLLEHGFGDLISQPIPRLNNISALEHAVRFDLLVIVVSLLSAGADAGVVINFADLLKAAFENGALQSASFLMEHGGSQLVSSFIIWKAAIQHGQFKLLMEWVRSGKVFEVTRTPELEKLALEALRAGNAVALEFFFRKGINIPEEEIILAFKDDKAAFKTHLMKTILEFRPYLFTRDNPLEMMAPRSWQDFTFLLFDLKDASSSKSLATQLLYNLCELCDCGLDASVALKILDRELVINFVNFLADQGADLEEVIRATDSTTLVNISRKRAKFLMVVATPDLEAGTADDDSAVAAAPRKYRSAV